MMLYQSAILVIFLFADLCSSGTTRDWSHDDVSRWPGQCNVGREQSPINIITKNTVADPLGLHLRGPLVYRGYDQVVVTARNAGYKARWAVVEGTPAPVLSGGPLRGNYTLAEVHYHKISEHLINGLKHPMEIHFLHLKHGLTLEEAKQRPDGVVVVSMLVQVGPSNSTEVLKEFLEPLSYIINESEEESPQFTVNVTTLSSPNPQSYYTYHGSLTTPGCQEVVTWIVMDEPTMVSHETYKNLSRINLSGINNDRGPQPINDRTVYRSQAVSICSHALTSSNLSLSVFLTCFASKLSSGVFKTLCKIINMKRKLFGKEANPCDHYDY